MSDSDASATPAAPGGASAVVPQAGATPGAGAAEGGARKAGASNDSAAQTNKAQTNNAQTNAAQTNRVQTNAAKDGASRDPAPRLIDRTRDALSRVVRDWTFGWTDAARQRFDAPPDPDLPDDDRARIRAQIEDCLSGVRGEAAGRVRAAALGRAYLSLSDVGKRRFFEVLSDDFGPNEDAVRAVARQLAQADHGDPMRQAIAAMRDALITPRSRLFRQFNALDQGVKFLVDLRTDLRRLGRDDACLRTVDDELRRLLASWFDVGFLELRRIDWNAPAAMLEKLIAYEAVHEIRSWSDLKNRLDSDRRCFAFIHPAMPGEPIIFVEVALVNGVAHDVQVLLDEHAPAADPHHADTAIFYSISNAQQGLAGVGFGDHLIKRVVADLKRDWPNLKTFATLSPSPGFRRWLDRGLQEGADARLRADEQAKIKDFTGHSDPIRAFSALIDEINWPDNVKITAILRPILMRLYASYLIEARRGSEALDPVARFHLSNGARIEHLCWLGDRSPKGLKQSCGLMVNYLYRLDTIEANQADYRVRGEIIASREARAYL